MPCLDEARSRPKVDAIPHDSRVITENPVSIFKLAD